MNRRFGTTATITDASVAYLAAPASWLRLIGPLVVVPSLA